MGNLETIFVENTNSLVLVLNAEAEVQYVSSSVKTMLGFQPEELLGNQWFVRTRKTVDERLNAKRDAQGEVRMAQTNSLQPFERQIVDAKGVERHILWTTSAGPDSSVVGIGVDITVRKQEEKRWQQERIELDLQRKELEESIRYTGRLQQQMLPDITAIQTHVNDAFVVFKPKQIVSGDFYAYFHTGNKVFYAVADCTGHGVPGAFIASLGNTILKDVILRKRIYNPARILEELDKEFYFALQIPGKRDALADGMDIALISIDLNTQKLKYAGAHRPLFIVRNGELKELQADKYPIGFVDGIIKKFTTSGFELKEEDMLYLFSDGYTDQFGGDNVKKFNRARFRKLLVSLSELNMDKQKQVLEESFLSWMGREDQVDDVTVMGIKI